MALQLPPPRKNNNHNNVKHHNILSSTTTITATIASIDTNNGLPEVNSNNSTASKNQQQQRPERLNAPSYEERCRSAVAASKQQQQQQRPKLFVPRRLQDFDDGGAFPEIQVAQYPRHMGNPHLKKSSTTTSSKTGPSSTSTAMAVVKNVQVDAQGAIAYDAIVTGGTNSDKLVYTKWDDLRGGPAIEADVALPTAEEEAEEAVRTQAALMALVAQKAKTSSRAMVAGGGGNDLAKSEFIQYTARPDAPGYNPSAATRIIQMVPARVDPLMPPKHKHVKAPRGPAEDFVPILHQASSSKKLTAAEQEAWKIPACISNWKNQRGYTIPLDKRLAADGRGLLLDGINDNTANFAQLSESLWTAERLARAEVQGRARTQQALAQAAARDRDEALRSLAQQARNERGGGAHTTEYSGPRNTAAAAYDNDNPNAESIDRVTGETRVESDSDDDSLSSAGNDKIRASTVHHAHDDAGLTKPAVVLVETDDAVAARQRDRLREERKKDRERAYRAEQSMTLQKKQRLEEERDVSEQIALGVHHAPASSSTEAVDARLYNQSAGMDAGFGAEDEYNAYSQPLFAAKAAAGSMYRPTRGETEFNADEQYDKLKSGATTKFQPHKGFDGADGSTSGAGSRTAPVQFERAKPK